MSESTDPVTSSGRLQRALQATRTELWPVPTMGVLLGLLAGIALPRLDEAVDGSLGAGTTAYLFGGGPSAAREVLGAVAGSLITVTSLTFSLTVVTLQLASSQFSPRLLRTFTRDGVVHATLALFLGTFTYSLAVLRTVRDADSGGPPFAPQIAVTVAFVLAVVSVVGLVVFLAHLAREIRPETMLRVVHREADATISQTLSELRPASGEATRWEAPDDAVLVLAASSGFVEAVAEEAVLRAAQEADAVVWIECPPGASVVAGTPVGRVTGRDGPLEQGAVERLRDQVAQALRTGFERTETQDAGFGLRQLTDVASKALSPGINDPTTATHALGHCSALLCALCGRDTGPRVLRDEGRAVRVVLTRTSFRELLDATITQPRRYGAADPLVLLRLCDLLAEVAWASQVPEQAEAVAAQLERLRWTVHAQDFNAVELARLAAAADRVEGALAGRWTVAG